MRRSVPAVAVLRHQETFTTELTPGPHRIRAHNTLFWKTIDFEVSVGEHASFMVARVHAYEGWAFPAGPVTLTRWITHLCAPGFMMLLGAGMVWLGKARQQAGWTHAQIPKTAVEISSMSMIPARARFLQSRWRNS